MLPRRCSRFGHSLRGSDPPVPGTPPFKYIVWPPVLYFPVSAVGIPLAFFAVMLLVAVLGALLQHVLRCCSGCCPYEPTAAETWGRSIDLMSPAKVLKRSAMY